MSAVLGGKRGNWFEEDYVLLQHLRLLAGSLVAVHWDGDPELEERGIDCSIEIPGGTVEVQCKRRGSGKWTLADLTRASAGRSVLRYARSCLEDESAKDRAEFRFVSNAPVPQMESLLESARHCDHWPEWVRGAVARSLQLLLQGFELDPDGDESRKSAWELCRRISTDTVGDGHLRQQVEELCGFMAERGGVKALESNVLEIARARVTNRIDRPTLRRELEKRGVRLRPELDRHTVSGEVDSRRQSFARGIRQAAKGLGLAEVAREETDELVHLVESASAGDVVVVHGPPGSGKSMVLADLVSKLELPVLPVRADEIEKVTLGGESNVPAIFRQWCGEQRGCLVVDQLDQLRNAGGASNTSMHVVENWVLQARRLGLCVVVGCRTVDAQRDTLLRQLLSADAAPESVRAEASGGASSPTVRGFRTVRIGDLRESDVVAALADAGIAFLDLASGFRRLLLRPLPLALFLNMRGRCPLASNCTEAVHLMNLWWESVLVAESDAERAAADAVLDSMSESLVNNGTISCAEASLPYPRTVEGLVEMGIFQRDPTRNGHVRAFHQMLVDARVARRWSHLRTAGELVGSLGSRGEQSLVQARRLRLAIPLLAENPGLVGELCDSTGLRPLLVRAVLSGVAEIEEPTEDLVDEVRTLAARRPGLILEWVAHGHSRWVTELRAAMDEAWTFACESGDGSLRWILLRVLASVRDTAGDVVAALLSLWSNVNPSVLEDADIVFREDPLADSDDLFDERLRFESLARRRYRPVDWPRLFAEHPERGARLLAVRVRSCSSEVLREGDPSWSFGLDVDPEAVAGVPTAGALLLREVSPWWCDFVPPPLAEIRAPRDDEEGEGECGVLIRIVRVFAGALAGALARGELAWDELHDTLPFPLREIDGLLLLHVVAALPTGSGPELADPMASWFISDERWAHIEVGERWGTYDLELAGRVVERLGVEISDAAFRLLENFLVSYPDEWTAEDHKRKRNQAPTRRGLTARILLDRLPSDRRSAAADRLLAELRRKFTLSNFVGGVGGGGTVEFALPDHVVDRWSPEEWSARLRDAPERRNLTFREDGRCIEYSRASLSHQLGLRAWRSPQRYEALARSLDEKTPSVARSAILSAIGQVRPESSARHDPEWAPLTDEEVATILERPAFLLEPPCARTIGRIVLERRTHDWSDPVVERLCAIATEDDPPGMAAVALDGGSRGYRDYRLNHQACVALEALAAVASRRPDRRRRLLELAKEAVTALDPGRRASAARLAVAARDADPDGADEAVLLAARDLRTAAEQDIARVLFALATGTASSADHRLRARRCLLDLALGPPERKKQLRLAGEAAVQLRLLEAATQEELERALATSVEVRRGAAMAVSSLLHDPAHARLHWLRTLAIGFVAEGGAVRETLLTVFLRDPVDHLLEDAGLFHSLLGAGGGRGSLGPLLEACDRRNQLLNLSSRILDLARCAAERRAPTEDDVESFVEVPRILRLLSRLVEEAEVAGSSKIRAAALDAWDALLESGGAEERAMLTGLLED